MHNINKQIRPKSLTDAIALQHDLDYLKAAGQNTFDADYKAIKSAMGAPSLESLAMIAGLGTKIIVDSIYDTKVNKPLQNKTIAETQKLGYQLEEQAKLTNLFQPIPKQIYTTNLRKQEL